MESHAKLSRRERQLMDIIYRRGRASVAEVMEDMADVPSYSSVRTILRILEEKGHLRHEKQGPRFVFRPTVSRDKARRSALRQIVHTFFDGSVGQAVLALLEVGDVDLSEQDVNRLTKLIEQSQKREGNDHDRSD
ncbi:MAG TPA: BlaI/MecI/CopY family transcriptional regulator [bacterium]|nr:BlaI/MecI/CopY family transcriptional regulator [bacterium]HPO07743.1 BlaI/MecI/CopY family transcriptional regulator [bacterium]HQO33728.1 BlaI/MecI/CopY family transcriptional regulator [bacterium]HQP99406.1 BlaI/MecI/CopY family transcriptional regulator [bacterium]